jgi:hypothetical protein
MTHSRKSAAQREKSLDRLRAFRERKPPAVTPFESPEAASWRAAYSGHQITSEGASWPDDGRHVPYMRWQLPVSAPREFRPRNQQ